MEVPQVEVEEKFNPSLEEPVEVPVIEIPEAPPISTKKISLAEKIKIRNLERKKA